MGSRPYMQQKQPKPLETKFFPYLLHKCKNWSQRYPSSCPTSGRMLPLGHSRAGSKQPRWVKFIRNLVYRLNPGSLPSCHCKRLLVMAQCLGDPAWLNSPLGMQIPTPIHWRLLEDNITQSLSSVACPESIAMRSGKQSLLLVNFPWAGAHRNITVICNKENIILSMSYLHKSEADFRYSSTYYHLRLIVNK